MINRSLSWVNGICLCLTCIFLFSGVCYWLQQPDDISGSVVRAKEEGLPKGAFELPEIAYQEPTEALFSLEQAPPTLQLPDLKQQLIYYGKNGRPDAEPGKVSMHFSTSSDIKDIVSISEKEKLYLISDRKGGSLRYSLSPKNAPTSIWIEPSLIGSEAEIHVVMENENGEQITEPEAFAKFRLNEKDAGRYNGGNWDVGSNRADSSLLNKQRARWIGGDKFLEHHGGEDFKAQEEKQRIDFGEEDNIYSVFVKVDDCLFWTNNRWESVQPGQKSLGNPLLVVKKIDGRIMSFELWDTEGKGKVMINLLKSTENWTAQNEQTLQQMFKFLGARTKTQFVFEINQERVILRPSDWLLLTPKGWKKLATEDEIDQYVQRKLLGTLFVFEGVFRRDEQQIMKGTLYSPSRNDFEDIEFALLIGGASKAPKTKETKNKDADARDDEMDSQDYKK